MANLEMLSPCKTLLADLRSLEVVYGYLVQNAPTEEARRLMTINLMTVRNSIDVLTGVYNEAAGEMPPMTEIVLDAPIFTTFVDAARYAFLAETSIIEKLKNLHMMANECYRMTVMGLIIAHQLNAMRLLYLIG